MLGGATRPPHQETQALKLQALLQLRLAGPGQSDCLGARGWRCSLGRLRKGVRQPAVYLQRLSQRQTLQNMTLRHHEQEVGHEQALQQLIWRSRLPQGLLRHSRHA